MAGYAPQGYHYQPQQQPYGGPPPNQGYQQHGAPQPNYGYAPPAMAPAPSAAPMGMLPGAPGGPSGFAPPSSKVLLKIGGRDLKKLDTFSESDPMCVVYMKSFHTGSQLVEIGRTEGIKNNPNPNFATGFQLDYFFEEKQQLVFRMYDTDGKSHMLDTHDFVGEVSTSLGEIVGASSGSFVKPLVKGQNNKKVYGQLHVHAEELNNVKGDIELQFAGLHLDKKDFFGKSDPYIEFASKSAHGAFVPFHKTEVVMKSLNPTWKKFSIPLSTFCNGDMDRKIQITVYDWDSDGSHDKIGAFETTANELLSQRQDWDLINPKKMPGGKKAKKGYKNSGVLQKLSGRVIQRPTFFEYLVGGLELSFTVGIDFTGSNGNPSLPQSLHYINPHAPNQYIHAIQAVGNIIQDYDTDKMFPAMGYGGKVNGAVSHCFPLNGNPQNPFCTGVPGIIQAYQGAIQHYQLWGPTNFAPIIHHVEQIAAGSCTTNHVNKVYFVLLIITDGVITDRDATIDAIVKASNSPMSIIIIGVGNADFAEMEVLDGDGGVLRNSRHEPAKRDIVQFVPYRDFHSNDQLLAKEVLAELPDQVIKYMSMRGVMPNQPSA